MCEFSIIIPVFNRAEIVTRTIKSVINQSFQKWELIVIDDGSTDHTKEILTAYLNDKRIRYYYQENGGVSKARNLGAAKALSEWLILLDSDDELNTDALLNFKTHIDYRSDCALFIAGNLKITSSERIINLPQKSNYYPFLAGTFSIKKAAFDEVGGYDTRLRFSENTELFHRITLEKIEPFYLNSVSLIYYESENGGSKNLQNMIGSLSIILDKHRNTLSSHVKYLYHQIIGVNNMRFQNFSEARKHLLKAISYKPYKAGTLARFCISLIPPLARKLYPKEVRL